MRTRFCWAMVPVLLMLLPACGTPTPTTVLSAQAGVRVGSPVPRPSPTGTLRSTPSVPASPVAATPAATVEAATPSASRLPNCLGVPPPPPADENTGIGSIADGPRPVPEYAKSADLAVMGTVVSVLPARFATPDCAGSLNFDPRQDPDFYKKELNVIITPVVLALDGPPVASRPGVVASQQTLVIVLPGGQVGPYGMDIHGPTIPGLQFFQPGESVLVVLRRRPNDGQPGGEVATEAGPAAWDPVLKYTRNVNGTATGYGEIWDLPPLIDRIQRAMASS